jgi:hypothetical protein
MSSCEDQEEARLKREGQEHGCQSPAGPRHCRYLLGFPSGRTNADAIVAQSTQASLLMLNNRRCTYSLYGGLHAQRFEAE